ncbi:MAG: MerR family transcriptional regulator [Pseudomonadota bacterium]
MTLLQKCYTKKYYTISEAAELLITTPQRLRDFDQQFKNLTRIRGRRYYQKQDIEFLKQSLDDTPPKSKISIPKTTIQKTTPTKTSDIQLEFGFAISDKSIEIDKINDLLARMLQDKADLRQALLLNLPS